ncbi:MAG: hypothetical protein IKY83_11485 [Proteobacteria bacterium]|nr:hypothetical protein [Pseudomonadota bacterium]
MRLKTLAISILFGCLSLGTMSCGAPQANIPTRSMPAGASFSGLWYTTFGDLKLTQRADGYTRGTFDYKTDGEVEGKVEGGVFILDWIQPGDFQVGRREVKGKAFFVISDDGLSFEGRWGYNDSYDNGGIWKGTKATEIYH